MPVYAMTVRSVIYLVKILILADRMSVISVDLKLNPCTYSSTCQNTAVLISLVTNL